MLESVKTLHEAVRAHVGRVIVGKTEVVDLVFISMLCGGHILIDDVPGTGKTVLAKTFAEALDLDFKRVQCVPDMLPSDLVGVNFFDMKTSEFRFLKGPVFTNVLLADEINRAMPKTQSGLLECMEERQVTVEGKTYPLDEIFTVIATQNPIETKGTFDLPEAQLDRFLVKTSMGYPSASESVEILRRKLKNETAVSPSTRIPRERLTEAREAMNEVYVHEDLLAYASTLCEATRQGKDVLLGASPRAMIALVRVAQGYAAIDGRDHVLPDDIKRAAIPVLAHRIVFANSFYREGDAGVLLIARLLETVPVPSEEIDFAERL